MPVNYDLHALDVMVQTKMGTLARKQAMNKLVLHSEGRYPCPDCGDCGPHDVQGDEYACRECGMQHPVPPVPRVGGSNG